MKFYYGKRVLAGFVVSIVTLLLSGVFSFLFNRDFVEASKMVAHTNEVLYHIEHVQASLSSMRAYQLQYAITKDSGNTQNYKAERDSLDAHLASLKELTVDNSNQQARLDRLTENIRIGQSNIAKVDEGALLVKERDDIIRKLKNEEKLLLQQRMEQSEINIRKFNYAFIFLIFFTLVLLVMVFITVNANLRALTHTEAALRKASDEALDLYEHAPCGYHSLDGKGYFTDINATLLLWLGYKREEVIGNLTLLDVLTTESKERFKINFPEFKRKGVITNLEMEFVRKDGRRFPVVINSSAIYDSQGNYIKSRSSSFDITELKSAERKLLAASAEIHDLYDNAPCGYYSTNSEGLVLNMNSTLLKWLGYSRSEMIGKMTSRDFICVEEPAVYDKASSDFKRNGYIESTELEMKRKNGTTFPLHLSATAVKDEDGNFVRSRASVFDITQRRKAERKAHELHKELEAFTYSVSHDLRAPLRSISGFMKILEEDYSHQFDQEGKRIMNTVLRNAKIMGQLIDDLLEFSRNNRNEMTLEKMNMDSLVRSIVDDRVDQNKDRKIHFQIDAMGDAHADNKMIRQVWINLIDNAIKYTRPKGEAQISITCRQEGDKTIYTIKDNGVGFDMKYAGKLFGVFQRLHRMEDFEGTGVGLALVHRIITRHGGKIWAEAEVNGGASFSFYLLNEPTPILANEY